MAYRIIILSIYFPCLFPNSGYSDELSFIDNDVAKHLNHGKHFYVAKCPENQTYHLNNQYEAESGDTISSDDIVRIQYLSLPYPPVSKERLVRESCLLYTSDAADE